MKKLSAAGAVLGMTLGLLWCSPLPGAVLVEDNFDRNGIYQGVNELGTMSDGIHSWHEREPISAPDRIGIRSYALATYYTSGVEPCDAGASIDGFMAANGKIRITNMGRWGGSSDGGFGITYRAGGLEDAASILSGNAYHVCFNKAVTSAQLLYGTEVLASAALPGSATDAVLTIEVEFAGNHHTVTLNGTPIIDFTESTAGRTAAGYIGVGTYWNLTTWDDFSVSQIDALPQDNFNRNGINQGINEVGTMSDGIYSWYEREPASAPDRVGIRNQVLATYYTSASNPQDTGAAVNDFTLAHGTIRITNVGRWSGNGGFGVTYRAGSLNDAASVISSGAYHAYINAGATTITLQYGSTVLATASLSIASNTTPIAMEVTFVGNHHLVTVNGAGVIDFTDTASGRSAAGYLGVGASRMLTSWDDFSVAAVQIDTLPQDNFNRNGINQGINEVGTMSDGIYSWYEREPASAPDRVGIRNQVLATYYTSASNPQDTGAAVNGFTLAYGTICITNVGRWSGNGGFGVTYRAGSLDDAASILSSAAYHANINASSTAITLQYGSTVLATASLSISSSTTPIAMEVTFVGNHHLVTVNGAVVIDFTDTASGRSAAGYLGVGASRMLTSWDDFSVSSMIPGDANEDDRVNFADFAILQNNYGQSGRTWGQGDFNGDGLISFEDFSILQNNYGAGQAGSSAPTAAVISGPDSDVVSGIPCSALGLLALSMLGLGSPLLKCRMREN